ncbi:MAG: hypothetical protein HQL27_09295 [Candidatus Omnitrophica bacterium]|nr:hypothetical protein [Candidatus Omnitrophota bacterium]
MANTEIAAQLNKLVEIQKFDKEIYILNKELEEMPGILQNLRDDFESKKKLLGELEENLKKLQLKRKDLELDLKSKEEQILKTNSQLSQLKTNKEYAAKLSEIEHIKADKSIVEEKILMSFDESDAVIVEVDKEKQVVSDKEKLYLGEKKKIEDRIKEIQSRLNEVEAQRNQIAPGIDKQYLSIYERIMKHKEGLGIVPIRNSTCTGCFMSVTSQVLNLLKLNEEIVRCEICSRIIYSEDEI